MRCSRAATVVALLVLAACGSSGSDDEGGAGHSGSASGDGATSGAGGGAGSGTANAGSGSGSAGTGGAGGASAGGSSGGSGAGNAAGNGAGGSNAAASKYAVCIAYARTIENRVYRDCVGAQPLGADEHAMREVDCPDLVFADGSNRTIDDVLACAEQWRATSCDDLLARRLPDCLPHGQRAAGAACMFNVQCASGHCGGAADAAGCKHCVELAAVGASCVDPGVECPSSAPCDGSTCKDFGATPLTGGDCGEGRPCPAHSQCAATAPGVLECMPFPALGDTCDGFCDAGLICSTSSGRCEARPALGQPCPDGGCTDEAFCHDGVVFDPAPMELDPICLPRLTLGDECPGLGATDDEQGNGSCALDLVCDCDDDTCTLAHCLRELFEGEACGAQFSFCTPGTACTSGVCAGVESQGLSDACR